MDGKKCTTIGYDRQSCWAIAATEELHVNTNIVTEELHAIAATEELHDKDGTALHTVCAPHTPWLIAESLANESTTDFLDCGTGIIFRATMKM